MTIDVAIGTFTDPIGNLNTVASNTLTYTVDSVNPVPTLVGVPPSGTTISGGQVVAVTVELSQPSTDFITGDITVVNGTVSDFT